MGASPGILPSTRSEYPLRGGASLMLLSPPLSSSGQVAPSCNCSQTSRRLSPQSADTRTEADGDSGKVAQRAPPQTLSQIYNRADAIAQRTDGAKKFPQTCGRVWPLRPRSAHILPSRVLSRWSAGKRGKVFGHRPQGERSNSGTIYRCSHAIRGRAGDKHHDHSDAQAWPRVQRYLQPQEFGLLRAMPLQLPH
jgi:hypothetical protein